MAINITGKGEATWKFLPNGKIEEKITKLTVSSGKMGKNDAGRDGAADGRPDGREPDGGVDNRDHANHDDVDR